MDINNKSSANKATVNEHQSYVTRSGRGFQDGIYTMIIYGLKAYEKVMVAQPSPKIQTSPPNEDEKKRKSKRFACLEIHTLLDR